ncbi:fungal-specific transcription factor domain-containing protein [Colletotrichum cereale]|nr:fungal-specific transcription factor domain-containing protein [Colletotrichum cereale]
MDDMGNLPVYSVARELVLTYFRIWHPLVPFLQGPETLANLDSLYRSTTSTPETESMTSTSLLLTFRCIFNIARLEKDGSLDMGSTTIRSPSDLLPTLSRLALRCDAASIQALLCAQVYLISIMSLRHASSVSGLISKSVFQSGMHRCPVRYGHLSPDQRLMRKRIFWSFYVLDRFVSQSLGHPSSIQDSDVDVCPPGHVDLHEPVVKSASSPGREVSALHLPSNHPDRPVICPPGKTQIGDPSMEAGEEDRNANDATGTQLGDVPSRSAMISQQRRETQAVLKHHVRHSQLVGRILEVFHKSIHARQLDNQTALFLKADVSAFGNDLIQPRLGMIIIPGVPSLTPDPAVFPFVSYHYAVLLLNRPSLSLDSRRAEFQEALQTCIGAANTVVHTIHRYVKCGGPIFWPGYMSAVWMSGLVLALAIRLELCNKPKAKSTVYMAIDLLVTMNSRWAVARHCEQVLSSLLQSIEASAEGHKGSRSDTNSADKTPSTKRGDTFWHDSDRQDAIQSPLKRRRMNECQVENVLQGSWANPARFNQHQPPVPNQPATPPALNAYGDATSVDPTFAPIPTAFPDQQRDTSSQYLDQLDGTDNFFDVFDGATWGSLLEIANGAGTVADQ